MQTIKDIERVYSAISDTLDISDDLFFFAESKYKELGEWLDQRFPQYSQEVYAQGSFALGTVVKPLLKDEYDLDLVCEFAQQYGLSARDMKCNVIGPALRQFGKAISVQEKRRCWQIRYDNAKEFHMDVVPAYANSSYIFITNKSADNGYSYLGSNPKAYVEWFQAKTKFRYDIMRQDKEKEYRAMVERAEIKEIPRFRIKTPLQRMIQLLKRHRDIMFKNDVNNVSPISIIITTIAASLYQNEGDVYSAMKWFLCNATEYVRSNMENGIYRINNPVYTGAIKENFAEKWNEDPKKAQAFFDWVSKARADLTEDSIQSKNRNQMAEGMNKTFGDASIKAYLKMSEEDAAAIQAAKLKVDTKTGVLSATGTKAILPHHHHGQE